MHLTIEKAGSVAIATLAIVGFFAILVIVSQQHHKKRNYINEGVLVKRDFEEKEWFEFEKEGSILAVPKYSIDFIEVGRRSVTLYYCQGGVITFVGEEANKLLEFAGLRHLIKAIK